mgnify:CR=1 FL=1
MTNPLKYLYYKILIIRQDSKVKIRVADITEKIKAIDKIVVRMIRVKFFFTFWGFPLLLS